MQPDRQTRRSPRMAGLGNNMRLGGRIDYSLLSGKAASRQDGLANPVDRLLPRLEGVQKAGSCWRARCPACGGQGRKVSITVGDDGRVLLTCFSCHDTPAVLGAVGLSIADLFPRRVTHATTPEERRELAQRARESQWAAALGVLAPEAGVIEVAASMIERGAALTADDLARVRLAAQRIHSAREVLA